MHKKKLGKNILFVVFSRGVSLLSSTFIGFLVPKFFSVTDYGYYKVFTLYAVYTALLHFGFVDGVLLKLSGKDYSELEKEKMRTLARFFIILELMISIIMIIVSLCFLKGDYLFVGIMLAINMLFVNVTTYYQFISQAVQRFKEYSLKSLIASTLKIIFTGTLFGLYYFKNQIISYQIFLIGLNAIDFLMMSWYIFLYRDITFGHSEPIKSMTKDIKDIFKTGIILTLAYQISHLVLALDRQFVNVLFSTETFAIYSFAYSIVSMISTLITSVSIVLLPMLKQEKSEEVVKIYKVSTVTVSIVAAISLLCYFIISPFIEWFLIDYIDSIPYIAIVLPSFLFTSVIVIVMFTMAKIMDRNLSFFKESLIVLCLGFITNLIAYIIFKSPTAISYASLLVMIVWFIISGGSLKKETSVGITKELFYLLLIAIGFLIITRFINNYVYGFIIYLALIVILTFAFYHEMLTKQNKRKRGKV